MEVQRDSVWQLCDRLKAEKLLVTCEVESLRGLHNVLEEKLVNLGLLSWNNRQYQIVLSRLLSSHPLVSPENTANIACKLDKAEVTESYKRLGHHHSAVGRLLQLLLASPKTIAEILNSVDSFQNISTEDAVQAIFSLVYGNGIFPSDEKIILEVLTHLVRVQLMCAADPRLILRKGNAAFPRLYRLFSESLFTSKIFLTAALHDPVMLVLCQDDIFLDIDPSKSPMRFPASERSRRFGEDPHSPQYHKKVAAHRKIIVEKLVLLAHNFIKGICDSLNSFPSSLIYLVKELHTSLVNRGMTGAEAMLICSDLIVTNLICPAIANPETIGIISDTPISHIARFNLMQIGQIIQTLVLSRHEAPPPHFQIFATQFRDSPICTIVESLLARTTPSLDSLFPVLLPGSNRTHELFCRQHFMGSLAEVNTLMSIFHSGIVENISSSAVREEMNSLCKKLPLSFASAASSNSVETPTTSQPQSRLRNFKEKVQISLNSNHSPSRLTSQASNEPIPSQLAIEHFDVVIFTAEKNGERIGLIPEETYMESIGKDTVKRSRDGTEKRARFVDTSSTVGSAISDRTTDHASDLEEETADEVASVSSSQEAPQEDRLLLMDEDNASTLPDNVSDVGGMSGRGSPSLSGRDTPLSQSNRDNEALEQEADVAAASTTAGVATVSVEQRNLPSIPVAVRKENADGLEEKFGKFTVPTSDQNRSYRDDQRSLLSDSWSTNVVASDDEASAPLPPPLPQLPQMEVGENRAGRPVNRTSSVGGGAVPAEDRSDTWSLDAIASDSETDGGRERDRQVREIQEEVQEQERAEAAQAESGNVQLIDVSVNDGERMRRQSSGSSFSYSRSDVGSERDHDDDRQSVPPLPSRPPVLRNTSLESRPSGSQSVNTSPMRGERLHLDSNIPGTSRPSEPNQSRRTLAIFQGLQKVGDKVRKGIANTPLRQLPHSSTFSDLFGDMSVNDKDRSDQRMSASRSENRLAGLDREADDILAKYQRPSPAVLIDVTDDVSTVPAIQSVEPVEDMQPYYSPENLSQCRAFIDTKRKLRLVLSSIGGLPNTQFSKEETDRSRNENEREQLGMVLRTLLAEAINCRLQVLSAHIREVMRCIQVFDGKGIKKLLRTLREEHRRRTSYVLYLQHSRLTLLRLISYLDRLINRIDREKSLTSDCIVDVLIRFYLENKDNTTLKIFIGEFASLKAQDEKIEVLSRTLTSSYSKMSKSSMWCDAPKEMLSYSRLALERVLMAQIHVTAFYPNHDADRHRDDLFYKAASKLARTITPDHPMLRIPSMLHGEAPWPSAQAEINIINAYKAARDKLACIVRCCETVSNLVSMAPGVGAAAADDITPVLVYVLIQANPPALFSNVQYVQSFGGALLQGAEGYWFTQFTAAIEFIKTLL